jgi:hypothetical protein
MATFLPRLADFRQPSSNCPPLEGVSWPQLGPKAGRCQEDEGRGTGREEPDSPHPPAPTVSLVGQAAVFIAVAGPWPVGQGDMWVPAHIPSVSLLPGVSQLLATCKRAVTSVLWEVKALGADGLWLSA